MHLVASDLSLYYLPMSHTKDARLILVNVHARVSSSILPLSIKEPRALSKLCEFTGWSDALVDPCAGSGRFYLALRDNLSMTISIYMYCAMI